jgi:hypothetical protein
VFVYKGAASGISYFAPQRAAEMEEEIEIMMMSEVNQVK